MSTQAGRVKLTDLASCGGCAAKYSAARLEELLKGFVPVEAENLLVGLAPADDAAVYRLDDERALIFTLDFFPPARRRPRRLRRDRRDERAERRLRDGRHAAPRALDRGVPGGAADGDARARSSPPPTSRCARPAGCSQAVTRFATTSRSTGSRSSARFIPNGIWPKNGARPGDALFLTKPLGTGLVMRATSEGLVGTQQLERAIGWMTTLNTDAADVAAAVLAPNAVTDVTGFGLFGHAHEMADRSGVRIVLESARCPRSTARSIWRARACARAAIRATASSRRHLERTAPARRCSRSATTRRPRAACSCRCRRTRRSRSRRSSRRSISSSGASAASRKAPASSSASVAVASAE